MADDLDKFLAEQQAAELKKVEEHFERRRAAREAAKRRGSIARDRAAVVDELEQGSDELEALDKIVVDRGEWRPSK